MTRREITNYGRSVKERLLAVARASNAPYMTILVRYLQERLLYRLSQSSYRDNFLLKGGALLYAYSQDEARPTRDIDFLGRGISNDAYTVEQAFAVILSEPCEADGVTYDIATIAVESISQGREYHGLRLTVEAALDTIRQRISMDIGFGDTVTPGPQVLSYPLMLAHVPSVSILAYSRETVVAEKFEAMITLSVSNSRMKDFFDVYTILRAATLDDQLLSQAILSTFNNRGTRYVADHPLFTESFYTDTHRVAQWQAFLKSIRREIAIPFAAVGHTIRTSLAPYWALLQHSDATA